MKSMKKMLCLLLVAMLLVAAIPVAASASEYDATTVNYSVVFAVKDTSTNNVKYSSVIAVAAVSSDANDDAIRAAAASAAASAGFTVVTKDAIADRVAANGNADIVHNVIYGEIRTKIDTDNKQFKYVLEVTPRPSVETADVIRQAKIYIDKEGTGTFVDTGKTVDVTLVATTTNGTTTYALKSNGGASVVDIQGKLGANYANKQLSMRFECPTTSGNDASRAAYYVTVTGTNGSTGTNVPSTGNNTNNNNGVPGASGSTNGNNNTTGTIPNGNGSSSNGGSTGNGSNNGGSSNGTMNFPATVNFRVNGKVVYQAYVTNQTQLDAAKAHVITVVRNMGYQVTSWNGF